MVEAAPLEDETADDPGVIGRCPLRNMATRVPITLACTMCSARNYKTTRTLAAGQQGALELKKFCKGCKQHTLHRETK